MWLVIWQLKHLYNCDTYRLTICTYFSYTTPTSQKTLHYLAFRSFSSLQLNLENSCENWDLKGYVTYIVNVPASLQDGCHLTGWPGFIPKQWQFFLVINELYTVCVFTYLHWYSFALFTIHLHFS